MKFEKRKILLWLLSWGVLILVILYSPIGSPELYIPQDQNIYRPHVVNFSTGIANAPKVKTVQDYEEAGTGVADYINLSKTYTLNSTAGASRPINPTSYGVTAMSYNSSLSTQSSSGSAGGSGFRGSGGMVGQQNNTLRPDGISAFNTDLTGFEDPGVTRQLAPSGVLEGGTDPGEDPDGGLIPIGDGFHLLLLLSVGYVIKIKIRVYKLHQLERFSRIPRSVF